MGYVSFYSDYIKVNYLLWLAFSFKKDPLLLFFSFFCFIMKYHFKLFWSDLMLALLRSKKIICHGFFIQRKILCYIIKDHFNMFWLYVPSFICMQDKIVATVGNGHLPLTPLPLRPLENTLSTLTTPSTCFSQKDGGSPELPPHLSSTPFITLRRRL